MVTSTSRKTATSAPGSAKKAAKTATKATASPTTRRAKTSASTDSVKVTVTPVAANKLVRKKDKPEKVKVVRDSFTIPKTEYAQIAALKKRALDLGMEAKKSELIRAGLQLLSSSTDTALGKALGNVPTLKTGRPGRA